MTRSFLLAACFLAAFLFQSQLYAQTCYADAGRDTAICPGACVELGGAVPAADTSKLCSSVVYSWSPASDLSNPSIDRPMACPVATTVYTLRAIFLGPLNDTCCITTSSVTITVKSTCSINLIAPQKGNCGDVAGAIDPIVIATRSRNDVIRDKTNSTIH